MILRRFFRCLRRQPLDQRGGVFTAAEQDTLTGADIPRRYRNMVRRRVVSPASDSFDTSLRDAQSIRTRAELYTVYLKVLGKNGTLLGQASGCIIHPDGLVLTCHHVVNPEGNRIELFGDEALTIRATVNTPGACGGDTRDFDCEILDPQFAEFDMALLRMEGYNFPFSALRPADEPVKVLEPTLLPGYPMGTSLSGGLEETLSCSVFEGKVSSIMHRRYGSELIECCYLDGRAHHGNSGSPVFSLEDGRVIGVFCGAVQPDESKVLDSMNFFYPIHYFWEHFTKHSGPTPAGGN